MRIGTDLPQKSEKDNFWFIIGGIVVLAIALVLIFKNREMQSVPYDSYKEVKSQLEQHTNKPQQ